MNETILGFDIGGSKIAIVEGDYQGQIFQRREVPNDFDLSFEMAFRSMCKVAQEIMRSAKATGRSPSLMSISIGGPLDIEKGVILSPPNLPMWHGVPLKQRLSEHFGLSTFIEHDADAGALAEFTFGAGRGVQNLIFLTVGTGMGGGIILNGQIYRGSTDTAGEVGHIRIAEEGHEAYGKKGSWEGLCSAKALAALAHTRYPERWPGDVTPSQVINEALSGMPQACALIEEMGVWLGRGIAILVDILNPEMVIVGTLGVILGDMLLNPARRIMQEEALPLAREVCRIVPAQLGDRLGDVAALMGAINARSEYVQIKMEKAETSKTLRSLRDGEKLRNQTIMHLGKMIEETADVLIEALRQGNKILLFGNGGSAAEAQHFAGELMGRYSEDREPLPALALTTDTILVTCISNDFGFDEIFARQVRALVQPGDIAVGISTSGASVNVIRGLKTAKEKGAITIALSGKSRKRRMVADYQLEVPSNSTARIQEEHMAIVHCWCEAIDEVYTVTTGSIR